MMKKVLSLMLCCLLLCLCASALGETEALENGSTAYDMTIDLPQGAVLTVNEYLVDVDLSVAEIKLEQEGAPTYHLMIAYDELFADASLSDMNASAEQAFFDYATIGFTEPTYEMKTLDDGTRVMVLNEAGVSDYGYVLTVYHGYFVSIYIAHDDYAELTEEDIAQGVTLLDAVALTPAA